MKKINRRSFLKVLGIASAACVMTVLTGCDEEGMPSVPAGDGSTPLSYLKPLNGRVNWSNIPPEDPFGNTYTDGVNFLVCDTSYGGMPDGVRIGDNSTAWHSAEYSIDKKYKKLTMKLNPHKNMTENACAMVNIYADGKLIKTSPTIVQKTKETVEFEVDITDVEYLKIEVGVTYHWEQGAVILWDVKLWK